jgi:hypothetical protein
LNRSIAEEIIAGYEPTISGDVREEQPNPKRFKQNRKRTQAQRQSNKTRSKAKSGARDRKRLRTA